MIARFFVAVALSIFVSVSAEVQAQHFFDVIVQSVDDRVASGSGNSSNGTWSIGQRSYLGEFDSDDYAVNDPGWGTFGTGSPSLPAGADPLPALTDLEWDFLPMKIDNTISNLFYWDGSGTVQFGDLPSAGYELSMQSRTAGFIPVDGSPAFVQGEIIDKTDSIGAIHEHRFFFLDDGDGNLATDPADGIYLISLRPRVNGLDRSKPIFLVFGTPGSTTTALNDAQAWVDSSIDDLAPDFSADFDGDFGLDVDGDDLAIWRQGYGTVGATALHENGDATYDDHVNGTDFLAWQRQLGSNPSTFVGATSPILAASTAIPEPSTITLLVTAYLLVGWRRTRA